MQENYLIWFLLIFLAGVASDVFMRFLLFFRDRKINEMICDGCHQPRKLLHTKDKNLWLCRRCAIARKANKLDE